MTYLTVQFQHLPTNTYGNQSGQSATQPGFNSGIPRHEDVLYILYYCHVTIPPNYIIHNHQGHCNLPISKYWLHSQFVLVIKSFFLLHIPGTVTGNSVGKISSVLVPMKAQSGCLRYVAAFTILGKLKCSSKPTTTAPTSGSS